MGVGLRDGTGDAPERHAGKRVLFCVVRAAAFVCRIARQYKGKRTRFSARKKIGTFVLDV